MRKIFCFFLITVVLLFFGSACDAKTWPAADLEGVGGLDDVTDSLASDGDRGIVYHLDGTIGYYLEYIFDADSAVAESLPFVLQPDSGSGRWLLSAESYHQLTWVLEDPTASEDIGPVRFDQKIKVYKVVGVIVAGTSVTIDPRHGSDRSAAGTQLLSAATAISSTTTGTVITSFGDATLAANDFLWLETTALNGVVTELSVTVIFVKYWGT